MTIYVRSAALRHELNMCRSQLMRLINEAVGREVVTDIRFK
jgi:predicted nucleic acid-binding Zn ribbon protein